MSISSNDGGQLPERKGTETGVDRRAHQRRTITPRLYVLMEGSGTDGILNDVSEGGVALDATYEYGLPIFGNSTSFNQVFGQVAFVKRMPRLDALGAGPILDWLRETRWAFRLGGAAALPLNGEFFALGGGDQFR